MTVKESALFPLDEVTLAMLEASLRVTIDHDDDGSPFVVGEGVTMSTALAFASGYDPDYVAEIDERTEDVLIPLWSEKDVIESLIHEVRRLRALLPEHTETS